MCENNIFNQMASENPTLSHTASRDEKYGIKNMAHFVSVCLFRICGPFAAGDLHLRVGPLSLAASSNHISCRLSERRAKT